MKRKSNWYIYVITLIISFVLLGFFVSSIWDSLFPASKDEGRFGVNSADYRPSSELHPVMLLMLSEMKAGTPQYYMLMNYRPRDEVVVFVPLPENMRVTYKNNTGSIYEMYDNFGATAVVEGINSELGVECEHYIKFDRLSFIDFVALTGDVYVNIPSDITEKTTGYENVQEVVEIDGEEKTVFRRVKKEIENVLFPAGTQYLDGEKLYDYITYPFNMGKDYPLAVHGSAAMNLVNRNFRDLSSTELQTRAEKILYSTDTDLSFSDYVFYQPALQYNTENSVNPCEYYIPYGESDGGYFVIADNSAMTIRDRFGMTDKPLTGEN